MNRRSFLLQSCGALAAPRILFAGPPGERFDLASEAASRAARFLMEQQQADGSWTSTVYGAFKDGRALTALVALALQRSGLESAQFPVARAKEWIVGRSGSVADVFPVHNASWILQLMPGSDDGGEVRAAMTERLGRLQLSEAHGWESGHPFFGGWSYAPFAPRLSDETPPFQQPNLSATVLAMAGLAAAGVKREAKSMRDALRFVRRCQNYVDGKFEPSKFDDGGFFQMEDDPARNKAGSAGRDRGGRIRRCSYTSATADGIRGLLMAGLDSNHARVKAGGKWMDRHLDLEDVPDLRHYAACAVSEAAALMRRPAWHRYVTSRLLLVQGTDGSWKNNAGEMREDDPLVATALALMALG